VNTSPIWVRNLQCGGRRRLRCVLGASLATALCVWGSNLLMVQHLSTRQASSGAITRGQSASLQQADVFDLLFPACLLARGLLTLVSSACLRVASSVLGEVGRVNGARPRFSGASRGY